MFCSIGLKVAMGILKRVLVKLKRHAEQSRTPVDDLVVQAIEEVIKVYEEGQITEILCK